MAKAPKVEVVKAVGTAVGRAARPTAVSPQQLTAKLLDPVASPGVNPAVASFELIPHDHEERHRLLVEARVEAIKKCQAEGEEDPEKIREAVRAAHLRVKSTFK